MNQVLEQKNKKLQASSFEIFNHRLVSTMEPKLELNKLVDLECIDLQRYLKSKPSTVIETLYNHPSICLAVYRELPEIARQFVIRILFVEQPVPQAVIASWTSQQYSKDHSLATSTLSELLIWRSVAIPGNTLI